jgi:hypothetical protein
MFTEKEDDELFAAVEEGSDHPSSLFIENSALATYLPFQGVNIDDAAHKNDDTGSTWQNDCHHGYEDWEERFESFQGVQVRLAFYGTFDYHKEDPQKEEWDERRAFGYDVTYTTMSRDILQNNALRADAPPCHRDSCGMKVVERERKKEPRQATSPSQIMSVVHKETCCDMRKCIYIDCEPSASRTPHKTDLLSAQGV